MSPFWKYLIAAAGLALVVFLVYNHGIKWERARQENKVWHEVSRRLNESQKEVEKGREFKKRVKKYRDSSPSGGNDDINTCLLYSDQPTLECSGSLPE